MSSTSPPPLPPVGAPIEPIAGGTQAPVVPTFNERFPFPTWLELALLPLLFIVFQFLVAIPIAIAVWLVCRVAGRPFDPYHPVILLSSGISALPLLGWGWWRSRRPFLEVFAFRKIPLGMVVAVPVLAIGGNILLSELANIQSEFVRMPNLFQDVYSILFASPILGFILLAFVAPFAEEPLFRALLLGGLERRWGARWAVLVSALVFSLVHVNPPSLLPVFLLGLLYGWLYVRSGSLWPCILAHAVHNCCGHVVLYILQMDIDGYTTPPDAGFSQPLWFDGLGLLLLVAGLIGVFLAFPDRQSRQPCTQALPSSGDD